MAALATGTLAAPFLAALAGATGAAQLAIAVATPIPQFKKGTKGKKGAGVGLVGEEGAELVYMPSGTQVVPADRTKRYKDAVNAMIDGQFEQYVYKSMIAPALREATKKMEEKRNKSFAENVANIFNTSQEGTNPYRVYDGVRMNNKELAEAIGRAVAKYNHIDTNDRYYH
jgi:3-hydroxy-3-methylglutaryl CoA synthase